MKYQKMALFVFFIASMLLMLAACSDSDFKAAPGSVFTQCVSDRPEVKCQPCVNTVDGSICYDQYDYTIDTMSQPKDILFVVDNSGSMYFEQQRMGNMFPNFINMLQDVNYRIAITTTDVEVPGNPADNVNGFGAFQNGNLVPFETDRFYLDGSLAVTSEQDLFEDTITWEQTDICERNNYVDLFCPSGDERGILAAYLTMEKNPDSFIRPIGHMALVILSDEDEGSQGNLIDPSIEEPRNFIAEFKDMYPNKSLSVHSIIIQPGDTQCLNNQRNPGHPPGFYGNTYNELTSLTQDGIQGDICASNQNYSAQLEDMGESISQVREVLPCSPVDGDVQIDFIPEPNFPITYTLNESQNEIVFSRGLPSGTEVRFRFSCVNSES